MKKWNIIVAGVGGQGNILVSGILAQAAIDKGYNVILSETFGAAQRGGAVSSHIRISKSRLSPLIPEGGCDVLVAFEPLEALRMASKFLKDKGIVVLNKRIVLPTNVLLGKAEYPDYSLIIDTLNQIAKKVYLLDATKLAQKAGNAITMNMVMIGALIGTGLTPVTNEDMRQAIRERVPSHTLKMNLKAFEHGIKTTKP